MAIQNNIRKKLNIRFLAFALVPILLAGIIISIRTYNIQKQEAVILQREIASHISSRVFSFIHEVENSLKLLVNIQDFQKTDQNHLKTILSIFQSRQPAIDELILLNTSGQEKIFLSRLGYYHDSTLKSQSDPKAFQIPVSKGITYYGPVRFNKTTGEPMMILSIPVKNLKTGKPEYVFAADIRLKQIWDLVASIRPGSRGECFIVDSENRVIAHRNPSVVLRSTNFDIPAHDGIYNGINNIKSVIVSKKINFGDQEFYIIVENPVTDAMALAYSDIILIIIIIAAVLLIAISLNIFIIQQIVRPIQTIAETAQAISSGDLSRYVTVKSRDELGILASAFNSMTMQLKASINKLEQRVAERTAELASVNKELESFSYSVSHDLRAPLRHISGFINMLEKECDSSLNEKGQHYLKTISKSSQRMGILIDHLLQLSRTGRQEINKTRISLDSLVKEVIQDFNEELSGRNIQWKIDPLPDIYADRFMLRAVLTNLIGNAIKFTRTQNKAEIYIGSNTDKKNEIIFFIKDNGVGFDMKYKDKLFGVFQRLHNSDDFEGTGIGLANVQRIIQRHGGRTWAEGSVGEGATFYFSLRSS